MPKAPKKSSDKSPKKLTAPAETSTEPITVAWTLAELPSPQHRAGLAGLKMLVDFTRRHRPPAGAVLEMVGLSENGCSLKINLSGMTALFDHVYAADYEERAVEKQWTNGKGDKKKLVEPYATKSEERTDKRGKKSTVKLFVYRVPIPKGGALLELSPPDDKGLWIKLWREWLWNTLRKKPTTRGPYSLRARVDGMTAAIEESSEQEEPEDGGEKDVLAAWSALNGGGAVKLPSTYYLGSMDVNAENVPFKDHGRYLFLLHFWPYSVHIFVPQYKNVKGERKNDGFVVCIPDVSRLLDFSSRHEISLRGRSSEQAGFRPKQAIIDLAEASALEVDQWLEEAIAVGTKKRDASATSGFQVIHTPDDNQNVRIRTNRMVTPTSDMHRHARIVSECMSHLAKHQVLINALAERAWWNGFDRICATYNKDITIKDTDYCHDARLLFKHFNHENQHMSEPISDTPKPPRSLESIILAIVTSWIAGRLESKYKLSWDAVNGTSLQAEYEKKKSKLATEAFLAARSRPGREFARWFTATLCSVNQRSISNEIDFIALSKALDERPDQVRSLALLALSARG